MRINLGIDTDKTIPLAVLSGIIAGKGYGARMHEAVAESPDEQLVEAYCGEKHERGNGDKRFQRAGTTTRSYCRL